METPIVSYSPNLCSDLEYFRRIEITKYYFKLCVVPHLYEAFLYSLTEWETPPLHVHPDAGFYVSFASNHLGKTLLYLRNFAHDHNCTFSGVHYQYPTNRIVKLEVKTDGTWRVDSKHLQATTTNKKTFQRKIESVFNFKMCDSDLRRITQEGFPDNSIFEWLASDSITFKHKERNLCYPFKAKPKSKHKKQHKIL